MRRAAEAEDDLPKEVLLKLMAAEPSPPRRSNRQYLGVFPQGLDEFLLVFVAVNLPLSAAGARRGKRPMHFLDFSDFGEKTLDKAGCSGIIAFVLMSTQVYR